MTGSADIPDRLQLTSTGEFALLSNFNQLFELFLETRFVICQFDDTAHILPTKLKRKYASLMSQKLLKLTKERKDSAYTVTVEVRAKSEAVVLSRYQIELLLSWS